MSCVRSLQVWAKRSRRVCLWRRHHDMIPTVTRANGLPYEKWPRAPKLDKLERLASLITPGEIRVGIAYDLARVLLREEAQHTGPGFATLGQVVLVQPGGIAPKRDRVKVQGEGVGLRKQHRRHGADPARE